MRTITTMDNSSANTQAQCCAICYAPGASLHYGAISCSGCRSFFRRTVRRNCELKCRTEAGNCDMNKGPHEKCQKCRMEKCLEAGMKVEDVQLDRDAISSTLRPAKIKAESSCDGIALSPHSRTTVSLSRNPYIIFEGCNNNYYLNTAVTDFLYSLTEPDRLVLDVSINAYPSTTENDYHNTVKAAMSFDTTLCMLEKAGVQEYWRRRGRVLDESRNLDLADVDSLPDFTECRHSDMVELMGIAARALIDAAKCDADFCALPLRDQVFLIRSSCHVTCFMDNYRRSQNFPNVVLLLDEAHVFRYKETLRWFGIDLQYFTDMISAFQNVQPDPVEFVLLKNIAFWNSSICSSESKSLVHWKQQQFIVALEEYLARKLKISTGNHGRLLLLLLYCEKYSEFSRRACRTVFTNPDPLIAEVYIKEVDDQ